MALVPLLAATLFFVPDPWGPADSAPKVELKVTQEYLEPVCVDGRPVHPGQRRWRLAPGNHLLAFAMRNSARHSVQGTEVGSGIAVVRVMLEAGHKYEVEIRAPVMTFASRVWKRGEWKPVVRDRTEDRIVSGEPEWKISGCEP